MATAASSVYQPRWITFSIRLGAIFFIFALFVAAVFEADLRVLHAFQALIYVAIIVLTRRNNALGFGAGCLISVFWSYIFVAAARADIWALITGHTFRPDIALQLAAVGAHALIFVACIVGFLRLRPQRVNWVQFFTGGSIAIVYLLLLAALLRPEILPRIESAFGLS